MLCHLVAGLKNTDSGNGCSAIPEHYKRLAQPVDMSDEVKALDVKTRDSLKEYSQFLYVQAGRIFVREGTTLTAVKHNAALCNLYLMAIQKSQAPQPPSTTAFTANQPFGVKTVLFKQVPYTQGQFSSDLAMHITQGPNDYYIVGDIAGHGVNQAGFAKYMQELMPQCVQDSGDGSVESVLQKIGNTFTALGVNGLESSSFGVIRIDTVKQVVSLCGGAQTNLYVFSSAATTGARMQKVENVTMMHLEMGVPLRSVQLPLKEIQHIGFAGDGILEAIQKEPTLHAIVDSLCSIHGINSKEPLLDRILKLLINDGKAFLSRIQGNYGNSSDYDDITAFALSF